MVYHGWEGRSDAQMDFACSLAQLGYLGFACDLFGKGIRGAVTGDNSALIAPFLRDRAMLRARLIGTVEVVQSLPEVDPSKVAAIGFCFGGLCVLDLARTPGLERTPDSRSIVAARMLKGVLGSVPKP
jgi:dienelactone hydrolase